MTRPLPMRSGVKLVRISLILLGVFLTSLSSISMGQAPETVRGATSTESVEVEVEVPIIDKIDSHRRGFGQCGSYSKIVGPVITGEELSQLIAADSTRDRCGFLKRLQVDFHNHTLLTYGVMGDCFVRATARIFRNDSSRKYVLRVTKTFGGCRAGGSAEVWLVVEKLRPDYKVEVELFKRDESGATRRLDQR